MRKLAMIGIAFLLIVSIAYAGVLEYYGKIVGNVNVLPPTFYTHSEVESFANENYGIFKANTPADGPAKEIKATVSGKSGSVMLDFSYAGFLLPPMDSFYSSTWTFYYRVSTTAPGAKVQIYVYVYKLASDGTKNLVAGPCGYSPIITSGDNWKTVSGTCNIPSITLLSNERIMVEYWTTWSEATSGGEISVKIDDPTLPQTDQTRIEVSKT
jgi:hypothetical protein